MRGEILRRDAMTVLEHALQTAPDGAARDEVTQAAERQPVLDVILQHRAPRRIRLEAMKVTP